ncbi:hypothetical protein OG533_11985 [Streptomyces sp. NBC_01186]|uniref:hypothetical protein n=1 Tax=Streptomyces sp. NBC_01186 TaxID=2903765 RepID=UPI002E12ED43|nr:hypothetical protein OG533_11985 [Streptomyces sp. NBC_01186]
MFHARRPYAATALAAALLLSAAGCGYDEESGSGPGGDSPSPSASASAPEESGAPSGSPSGGKGRLTERQATSALLAPGNLPAGWKAADLDDTTLAGDAPDDLSTRDRNCKQLFNALGGDLAGREARTDAARDYAMGEKGPYLAGDVASYDGTAAIRAMSTFKSVRDSCTKFSTKNNSVVIDFTVSALKGSFLGEDSLGAELRGKAKGGPADGSDVALDLVLARAGQSTTGLAVLSAGEGDEKLTADAAKAALRRLQEATAGKTPSPTVPAEQGD